MGKDLFCVHVSGSDDLIPVRDIDEAVRAAAFLNAEYLYSYQQLQKVAGDSAATPCCFSSPAVWEGTEEDHKEWLEVMIANARDANCPHWLCA